VIKHLVFQSPTWRNGAQIELWCCWALFYKTWLQTADFHWLPTPWNWTSAMFCMDKD